MKKLMIGLLTLLTMGEGAMAQTVSVADVEAVPGETVSFSVDLSNGKADAYTALTFDVQFPAEGFTTTGTYAVSSSWSGATCVVGDVDASGLATVPFASADEIPGNEVENLVSVSFKVDENVAVGEYDVTLKNIMFEYGISDKDYAENVTFKVNVVASHAIVLDENSTIAPETATGVKVIVKRTIKADSWSTICLPFAMTEEQVKEAFGSDVELGDFLGCDKDDETGAITVNFSTAVLAIEANHPYVIRVSKAINEFSVDNVDIVPEEEVSIDLDEVTTGSGRNKKTTYNSFIGTYVADTEVPDYALYLQDNQFWFSTGQTKMKAFRAYFDLATSGAEYEGASAPVYFSFDNETTGIKNLSRETTANGRYYNLNGQRVVAPKRGLYIQDGKKIIKR